MSTNATCSSACSGSDGARPTGEATSGFHEEFTRALQRSKDGSTPELWLAFKQIDAGALADPGEQLKRVLEFKNEITNSRNLLYKEFVSTQDWSRDLQKWLLKRVAQLAKQQVDLSAQSANPDEATRAAPTPTGARDDTHEPLPADLREAVQTLARATRKTQQALDDTLADELTLVRLQVLAESYTTFRTGGVLHGQTVVSAYANRNKLTPTPTERFALFRTILADGADIIPGWFWFADLDSLPDRLLEITTGEQNDSVRAGALRALSWGAALPKAARKPDTAARLLGDASPRARDEAIRMYASLATAEDVTLLDNLTNSPEPLVQSSAAQAKLHVLARISPTDFITSSADDSSNLSVVDSASGYLAVRAPDLASDTLRHGLTHRSRRVRYITSLELARRNELSQNEASSLLSDESLRVRNVAARRLIDLNASPSWADLKAALPSSPLQVADETHAAIQSTLSHYLQTRPPTELVALGQTQLYGDGDLAYGALATTHFAHVSATIRANIKDAFSSLIESRIAEWAKLGPAADELVAQFRQLSPFISMRYVTAALKALAIHGNQEDAEVARWALRQPWGGYDEARVAALEVLRRFGTTDDVRLLMEVAHRSAGTVKQKAVEVAFALAPGDDGAAKVGLESEDLDILQWCLRYLFDHPSGLGQAAAIKTLATTDRRLRLTAIAYLIKHLSAEKLLLALNEYMQSEYYFNVVCWLDRALYAPEPLRGRYFQRLLEFVDDKGNAQR